MKIFKKLFNFYINASIHVALAVFSFVKITEVYFNLEINKNLTFFIFFSTIVGYNFVKYSRLLKKDFSTMSKSFITIQVFTIICVFLAGYFGLQLSAKTLLFFLPFAILTVLYATPLLAGFQKNLREISYLKIFIVAFVWAGVTVLIPVFFTDSILNQQAVIYFFQRFLFVIALTLPFEIRDMQMDIENVKTLPQKIGIPSTKKLGLFLLMVVLVLEFLVSESYTYRNLTLFICFILLLLLMRAKLKQSNYYSSFWVESLPIFWFLLLLTFR